MNVIQEILKKQQFKLNDETHRNIIRDLVQAHLDNFFGEQAGMTAKCDLENNDDETRVERKVNVDICFQGVPLMRYQRIPAPPASKIELI